MSIFEGSGTLELKSPLSKECWDKLADVELENTERMWFTTPSGKRVDYIRADVLDKIRAEIEAEMEKDYGYDIATAQGIRTGYLSTLSIIDKYRKGN